MMKKAFMQLKSDLVRIFLLACGTPREAKAYQPTSSWCCKPMHTLVMPLLRSAKLVLVL